MLMFVSMSISAIAYAFWFGPWLAILFVGLLLIHEMGHVVAMRMKGFDTPTPVFIPFLGAAIFAPKFGDRDTEAFIGYGGPLLGTIGALATFIVWFLLPDKNEPIAMIILVGSYLGLFLNLFNLIPISPLDGGRVTQAAGAWFKYCGLLALAAFSAWFREPVILYVWILVLYDFHVIPVRLRAVAVSSAWVAMASLMYLGYSDQPFWVDIMDCVVTTRSLHSPPPVRSGKPMTSSPIRGRIFSVEQRTKWFLLYAILTAFLAVVVVFQHGLLPLPHQG